MMGLYVLSVPRCPSTLTSVMAIPNLDSSRVAMGNASFAICRSSDRTTRLHVGIFDVWLWVDRYSHRIGDYRSG